MYGKYDFYDLKGIIEGVLSRLGITVSLRPESGIPTFHPGRTAVMYVNDDCIGIYGEASPKTLDNYNLGNRVYLAELDVDKLLQYKDTARKYEALPKYPSMVRDIAVTVKDDILAGSMIEAVEAISPYLIENVELFDVYKGEHIEEGYKSCAFSVTYRNREHTLKEKEVENVHNKILNMLEKKFDAKLR